MQAPILTRDGFEIRDAMKQGMQMLSDGSFILEPLVAYYDSLQAQQALDDLMARKEGLFKVLLTPPEQ
jgi:threonine dehydrogenase-like Zn-dependent dehydrogenase